jgi:hypothetical protein
MALAGGRARVEEGRTRPGKADQQRKQKHLSRVAGVQQRRTARYMAGTSGRPGSMRAGAGADAGASPAAARKGRVRVVRSTVIPGHLLEHDTVV